MRWLLMVPVVAVCLVPLLYGNAWACGGFFCDRSQPVDQAGEKILFLVDEAGGSVEAHIQIQYQGAAEDFSWVVPVPVAPRFDVGSDEVFARLAYATQPRFTAGYEQRGGCEACGMWRDEERTPPARPPWDSGGGGGGCGGGLIDGDADGDGEGVAVIDSGTVGPFEHVTLEATDSTALVTWLGENGYDLPETAFPIIASYVESGSFFVALKFTKDADEGELVPIVLEMDGVDPCIPLRLTAIAAVEDMPVFAWVLGRSRAISTTWLDVEPNDARLYAFDANWPGAVAEAVDEVGGRAFATEYAGRSEPFVDALSPANYDLGELLDAWNLEVLMGELGRQGFTGSQLLLSILQEFAPPPADVDATSFYNCPADYVDDSYVWDHEGLVAALDDRIIRPLREVHAAFRREPYLTRLYTVISPSEMTEDPEFAMNPDAPDVPLVREARVVRDCQGTMSPEDDYLELTTPAGHRSCTDLGGIVWNFGDQIDTYVFIPELPRLPAIERALQWSEAGPAVVVADEHDATGSALPCDVPDTVGPLVCGPGEDPKPEPEPDPPGRMIPAGGGCSLVGRAAGPFGLVALALALLALRRGGKR